MEKQFLILKKDTEKGLTDKFSVKPLNLIIIRDILISLFS
jgi:hypothetical protein